MTKLRLPALFSALVIAGVGHAQPAEQTIPIAMSDFKFEPSRIVLQHGRPYLLHFENTAQMTHEFTAKAFLAAVTVAPGTKAVKHGEIELKGGASADFRIVAPTNPGTFEIHCGKPGHARMGMTGTIEVQ